MLLILILLMLIPPVWGAEENRGAPLTERHQEWLEEEVSYIIADKEREAFLQLESEDLRNQFVEMFWKQRDPTPATAYNEYKEEHYRRLSYANTWFGSRKEENGWRSDRGRIYILFGEPQEKVRFTGENDIRDCEIWFYDAQGQVEAVPFFRLLFYQRSFGQDYVLYSPTHDGPQELAMIIAPTRQQALAYLWERAGQQVWEAAQSYIPSEPLGGGGWSPESELLLAKIENLNNTLIDPTWAESFLVTRGRVSTRLSFKNVPMTVLTRTLFNLDKEAFFHAGFEVQPENLKVGEIDGRFYSVFDIRTFVEDLETGQEVLSKADHWEVRFSEKDGAPMARPIAFEQVFPLVPGRYKVLWIIDDLINETFTFRQEEVEIPGADHRAPLLTQPLAAARYQFLESSKAGEISPFRIFNIEYSPDLANQFNRGDNLSVFFQYLFSADAPPESGVRFKIELTRPLDPSTAPLVYEHAVPAERLTEHGIVLVHRQIPVTDLSPGRYSLVVTALEGDAEKAESARIHLSYRGEEILVRPRPDVLAVDPKLMSEEYVLERTRQFEALGQTERAMAELQSAIGANGEQPLLTRRLEELRNRQQH